MSALKKGPPLAYYVHQDYRHMSRRISALTNHDSNLEDTHARLHDAHLP
jgi:hypothetical protein